MEVNATTKVRRKHDGHQVMMLARWPMASEAKKKSKG